MASISSKPLRKLEQSDAPTVSIDNITLANMLAELLTGPDKLRFENKIATYN